MAAAEDALRLREGGPQTNREKALAVIWEFLSTLSEREDRSSQLGHRSEPKTKFTRAAGKLLVEIRNREGTDYLYVD